MRIHSLLLPTVLVAAFAAHPSFAQNVNHSPAGIFNVPPGTNTLMAVRDAVRAWHAAGHASEMATVQLARGEFTLTKPLVLEMQDGNATWESSDPQSTRISGGRHIKSLGMAAGGVWRVITDFEFEQLFVNGRRATRVRAPATGLFSMENVKQEELPDDKARITVQVPADTIASLPTNPAALHAVQMLVYHKWDTSRYQVSSVDLAAGTISVAGKRMQPWNPWDKQSRFIFDNCNTVSPMMPGTWFLDLHDNLSYRPLPSEKIEKTDFIAPTIDDFLEIRGATNIHLTGLRFNYTGYRLPPDGCPPGQAAAMIGAAIEITGSQNVTFDHCEIAHTGNYGIWFRAGCRDCRIQHSLLTDLGAGGIRIGETGISEKSDEQTDAIVADNNIIRGYGRIHPSAVGVWIGQSANNRVTHNDISDGFYTGISAGWTWGYGPSQATNNFIGFNRIHQIGQGMLSDMGGIYTLGVSPGSAEIGNVIYDVRAHDYGGWGIYPDEGSTGWRIESNLVWNCTCVSPNTGGAFHQHYGATNLIANNIFALSSGPPMQATRIEDHLSFTLEHNIIVSSNAAFFTGPWEKIQFASRSNCFVAYAAPTKLFPKGSLADWQKTGHETGSILTNITFRGTWPEVTLQKYSPASTVGFKMFDPKAAGVYGEPAWKHQAQETAD